MMAINNQSVLKARQLYLYSAFHTQGNSTCFYMMKVNILKAFKRQRTQSLQTECKGKQLKCMNRAVIKETRNKEMIVKYNKNKKRFITSIRETRVFNLDLKTRDCLLVHR